jgi:subtilisin family serine protease
LIVKLAENQSLTMQSGKVVGPGDLRDLNRLLYGAVPLIDRSPKHLRAERKRIDPAEMLADLSLYLRITGEDVVIRGKQLLANPLVETAYLAPKPAPPPGDIDPTTPDFSELQTYRMAGPSGFGFDVAHRWPGGDGANVVIADIEYGFDPTHEELEEREIFELGYPMDWYPFHGNGVLGILGAPDNGYGITGLVPAAELVMVSPFVNAETYNVAESIVLATEHLDAGDILLIEQQGWIDTIFLPVEIDPAVFDAITLAVAKGIVVIEPAGNGACDLDPPAWDGWFDRNLRDSGAIIVGGGSSPTSGHTPRSWYPLGSCYGQRVDVQGWFDSIVTTSAADGQPTYTDLFFPDGDGRQAYTSSFGGTSGASPIIAAIAATMNSVAWETRGAPWNPVELRAAMVSTGTPQPSEEAQHIGPQPDLRRLLRTWGVR